MYQVSLDDLHENKIKFNKREKYDAHFFPSRFFLVLTSTAAVVVAATFFPDQSNLVLAILCPRVFLFFAQDCFVSVPRLVYQSV